MTAGTAPVARSITIAEEHGDGLLRPRAHGHGLPADELRRVDDEDVGVIEVLVERLPGPLEQQRVARGQHGLVRTLVLTPALHGQDDEIAAGRDHPRKHGLPDHAGSGRDDDLGETGRAVEQRFRDIAAVSSDRKARTLSAARLAAASASPRTMRMSPAVMVRPPSGPLPSPAWTPTRVMPGYSFRSTAVRGTPTYGRAGPHPELEEPIVEPVLLAERPGVPAEVGRHRPAAPLRQQALPEQHHDRHGPKQQRDPHDGELEVAEAAHAGVHRRLRHEHVHRRAGERQQRPGVGRKHEGHEQLRGRAAEPDGHDDDHRQEGGHRPVDADQRGEERDEHHDQDEQPRPALPRLRDQELPRPRRHPGGVEARADHEQRRDEDDRGVAEAGEGLAQIEDSRGVERERRPKGHEHHRDAVPDKERDDCGDDGEGERNVTQYRPFLRSLWSSLYPALSPIGDGPDRGHPCIDSR